MSFACKTPVWHIAKWIIGNYNEWRIKTNILAILFEIMLVIDANGLKFLDISFVS